MSVDPYVVPPAGGVGQPEAEAADPPTPEHASILVVDDRRANLVAMEQARCPPAEKPIKPTRAGSIP